MILDDQDDNQIFFDVFVKNVSPSSSRLIVNRNQWFDSGET